MNIQAVPSNILQITILQCHSLGTFHCPALLIAGELNIDGLIDEQRGHKETGVIRRRNVFSENYKRSSYHSRRKR